MAGELRIATVVPYLTGDRQLAKDLITAELLRCDLFVLPRQEYVGGLDNIRITPFKDKRIFFVNVYEGYTIRTVHDIKRWGTSNPQLYRELLQHQGKEVTILSSDFFELISDYATTLEHLQDITRGLINEQERKEQLNLI